MASDNPIPLLKRLRTMAASGWNPIGDEAADEIGRLQRIEAAVREVLLDDKARMCPSCLIGDSDEWQELARLVLSESTKDCEHPWHKSSAVVTRTCPKCGKDDGVWGEQ